jgi:hypothetical protein
MMINGVELERHSEAEWVERWMGPVYEDSTEATMFEATIRLDRRTGEHRLERLKCEVIPID